MKKLLLLMIAMFACVTYVSDGFAMEFSADMIAKDKQGRSVSSKMYMKPNKIRVETKGAEGYMITRQDKNIMWMIMPGDKMYMEMKYDPAQKPKVEEKMEGEISRKFLGNEKIDGHPTKKYEITYKDRNKTEKVYQWFATDIKFAIKTAAINGSWSAEYKNIKIVTQSDKLFEVPAGYRKMNVPAGVPGMGGIMPGMKK